MKQVIALGMSCALVSLALLSVTAQERLRAGSYDVTTTVNGKSSSRRRCLTAAEAKDANGSADAVRAALEKSAVEHKCTSKDFVMNGATVAFTTICGGVSMASKVTYRSDGFDGIITTIDKDGTHTMETSQRRVGDCP